MQEEIRGKMFGPTQLRLKHCHASMLVEKNWGIFLCEREVGFSTNQIFSEKNIIACNALWTTLFTKFVKTFVHTPPLLEKNPFLIILCNYLCEDAFSLVLQKNTIL
ncbi:hypothetical protein GOP47_0021321 [Adiantum capillus-veneris]|uniref:Uncharacterized protein n=1 Tax=Adiantum capillus-veneris TaxID=13818 RepID=A0A9D4UCN8_ADICA|nr:hypothetical protein GOP47_0021321 [Adiantum capillus-veneris]